MIILARRSEKWRDYTQSDFVKAFCPILQKNKTRPKIGLAYAQSIKFTVQNLIKRKLLDSVIEIICNNFRGQNVRKSIRQAWEITLRRTFFC